MKIDRHRAARPVRARLLITGPGAPAWNMGLDTALAELADGPGVRPTLRIYGWRPGAISLGRRQPLAHLDPVRADRPDLTWVRRPTGGGAIVHEDEVTYSLTGRYDAFGGRGRTHPRALYRSVHRGLARAVEALGGPRVDADAAWTAATRGGPGPRTADAAPLCFERPTDYDLLVPGHGKLAGSAQRRLRASFLQHGSMPLSETTPWPVGATSLAAVVGRRIELEEAGAAIAEGIAAELGLDVVAMEGPTDAELARAHQLSLTLDGAQRETDVNSGDRSCAHRATALEDRRGGSRS